MSILIKGMEMPTSCEKCEFHDGWCLRLPGIVQAMNERREDCPLVPVPPHGRLIDADALLKKCEFVCTDDDEDIRAVRYSTIEDAPTIIPAELPVHYGTFAATSEKEALKRIAPADEDADIQKRFLQNWHEEGET